VEIAIIAIIVFIGIAVIYDAVRKNRTGNTEFGEEQPSSSNTPTANEALPTSTGRFRVQQALQSTPPKDETEEDEGSSVESIDDNDEDSLPDPFSSKKV